MAFIHTIWGASRLGSRHLSPARPRELCAFLSIIKIDLSTKHVVVVGRSNIVGRPISILTNLKQKFSNATTTVCHSGTKNINQFTHQADVVILALGSPEFLNGNDIKDRAVIIDVGINRIDDGFRKRI